MPDHTAPRPKRSKGPVKPLGDDVPIDDGSGGNSPPPPPPKKP